MNKYKTTVIKDDIQDNLRISWDYWDNENDLSQRTVTFLYTPDMTNTDKHYHINLDQRQALALYIWLRGFLSEVDLV